MSEPLPVFVPEVRYYRSVLQLSYEAGHRALAAGVLVADAVLDSGRSLFSSDPGAVQKNLERLRQHRTNTARSRYNLPYAQV